MSAKRTIHNLKLIVHQRNSNLKTGSSIYVESKFKHSQQSYRENLLAWKHICILLRTINTESPCLYLASIRIPWQLNMEDTLALRRKLKTASVCVFVGFFVMLSADDERHFVIECAFNEPERETLFSKLIHLVPTNMSDEEKNSVFLCTTKTNKY